MRCTVCHIESGHWESVDASNEDTLPKCGACAGLLRPAVVWFGEQLPADALSQAGDAAHQAEVCLVIGTSGTVYPAAGLAFEAVDTGARLIVIDPGDTAFDAAAGIRLKGSAAEVVPALLAGLGTGG